ncbi:MAG: hypothetical protein CMB99_11930 [Flavobacteriaceae bacterium]|nr:hypothetical protein [Flavobacteriaceae bacterium]|tara:strand:- start:170662 stop:171150 length:489 start_codon:yes stop_codon:yes gene_type:complete
MKKTFTFLLFLISCNLVGQGLFVPAEVASDDLKAAFIKSNYKMNIIHSYLIANYRVASGNPMTKKLGKEKCKYRRQFKPNIVYKMNDCEEGKGSFETVIFPKAAMNNLKKWVEQIYRTQPMEIKNIWYPGTTEYGPEPRQEGCYYKILQEEDRSVIEIWCGS